MGVEQTLRRQATIVGETCQYLERDFGKYFPGAVGMWYVFGSDLKTGDAFRSTYYFFRHLDDVLDGDRPINTDPHTYAASIRSSLETRDFDHDEFPILRLAKKSVEHFDMIKRPGDDPQAEMLNLIDAMMIDRTRTLTRQTLSQEELIKYYRNQFHPIINLQLIALGVKYTR